MRDVRGPVLGQTTQAQCPNCGSSSAFLRNLYRNPTSGKVVDTGSEASLLWAGATFILAVLLLNVVIPALNKGEFGTGHFSGPLPLWAPFALGFLVLVVLEARRVFQLDRAVRIQAYRCRVCKHRWQSDI